eukprot:scaffold1305_cov374-Prasinococcus_capsulatus_cf.AAC.10
MMTLASKGDCVCHVFNVGMEHCLDVVVPTPAPASSAGFPLVLALLAFGSIKAHVLQELADGFHFHNSIRGDCLLENCTPTLRGLSYLGKLAVTLATKHRGERPSRARLTIPHVGNVLSELLYFGLEFSYPGVTRIFVNDWLISNTLRSASIPQSACRLSDIGQGWTDVAYHHSLAVATKGLF